MIDTCCFDGFIIPFWQFFDELYQLFLYLLDIHFPACLLVIGGSDLSFDSLGIDYFKFSLFVKIRRCRFI